MPEEQDGNDVLEAAICTNHVPKQEKIAHFQETTLLATNYDSNPEPKSFHKTKQTQDYTN
jgi:hypothetical protein